MNGPMNASVANQKLHRKVFEMIKDTAENMREYGFSLTRMLSYKDKIYDFVLIRENMDQ